MSTAPHLWRKILEARHARRAARGSGSVSQPNRAGGRRAPPAPAGHRRCACARDDAGDRRCGSRRRGMVPRPCRLATSELLERLAERTGRGVGERERRSAAEDDRANRCASSPPPSRPCSGSELERSGTSAPRSPTGPSPACRHSCGAWRHAAAAARTSRRRPPSAINSASLLRPDLRPGPVRTINMSQLGQALTDRGSSRRSRRSSSGHRIPAQVAPDQERGAGRAAPRGPVHGRARAVHDRHRRSTPMSCCRRRPSSSTSTACSRGVTTTTRSTSPRSSRSVRPSRTRETFRLLAARMGLDDPCFAETDEEMLASLFAPAPAGITWTRCASAAG